MAGPFWHFTCEHGRAALGDAGELVPAVLLVPDPARLALWWPARLVWLSDLPYPDRQALGLTSHLITCDRTAHRYRVTDAATVQPWARARRPFRHEAAALEVPGTRPAHWYVSGEPVPVEYDPLRRRW